MCSSDLMNRLIESLVLNLFWSVDHDDEIDRAMLEVEAISGRDSMNCTVTSFFQVRLRNRYSIVRKWYYHTCRRLNC